MRIITGVNRFALMALIVAMEAQASGYTPYSAYMQSSRVLERYALSNRGSSFVGYRPTSLCSAMELSYARLSPGAYKSGYAYSEGIHWYFQRSITFAALLHSLYYFEQQRHQELFRIACSPSTSYAPWVRRLRETKSRMLTLNKLIHYENRQYAYR